MTTKPTPTVIESDLEVAQRGYRCVTPAGGVIPGCPDHENATSIKMHNGGAHKMAAEIAAAREADYAKRTEAVAALVDKWEGEAATYPVEGAIAAVAVRLCARELRAALERVKGVGA